MASYGNRRQRERLQRRVEELAERAAQRQEAQEHREELWRRAAEALEAEPDTNIHAAGAARIADLVGPLQEDQLRPQWVDVPFPGPDLAPPDTPLAPAVFAQEEPPHPTIERTFWLHELLDNYGDTATEDLTQVDEDVANLIASLTKTGMHAPALDLDFPARLVPSSTEGHYHLYLEREIPWPAYQQLLLVLSQVGLLEPEYVQHSLDRGATFLRKEGTYKLGVTVPPHQREETIRQLQERVEELEAQNRSLQTRLDAAHDVQMSW